MVDVQRAATHVHVSHVDGIMCLTDINEAGLVCTSNFDQLQLHPISAKRRCRMLAAAQPAPLDTLATTKPAGERNLRQLAAHSTRMASGASQGASLTGSRKETPTASQTIAGGMRSARGVARPELPTASVSAGRLTRGGR
jgi:hypothetical protein